MSRGVTTFQTVAPQIWQRLCSLSGVGRSNLLSKLSSNTERERERVGERKEQSSAMWRKEKRKRNGVRCSAEDFPPTRSDILDYVGMRRSGIFLQVRNLHDTLWKPNEAVISAGDQILLSKWDINRDVCKQKKVTSYFPQNQSDISRRMNHGSEEYDQWSRVAQIFSILLPEVPQRCTFCITFLSNTCFSWLIECSVFTWLLHVNHTCNLNWLW